MRGEQEGGEDRLSQLPEALILHILSLLPTKDVISTSVLSKQWRPLWKIVPKLMFDFCDHKPELGFFSKDVIKTLASHKAPVLESFHLEASLSTCTAMDVGILLGIAFGRNVRKLLLDVYLDEEEKKNNTKPFVFPASLFYTCETLETLILRFHVLVDVPSQIRLKSLRTLHLDYMDFQDEEESVLNLLAACPRLLNLVLKRTTCGGDSIPTFTIAVETLETLYINDENQREDHCGYLISAPSLKDVHIEVEKGPLICTIENSPQLVTAKIFCEAIDDHLLASLISVKMLSLLLWSPLEVKYHSYRLFDRLVHLEIYTGKPDWWNLLTLMLMASPKLKVLMLRVDQWHKIEDRVFRKKWKQPNDVPECLLFHLERFVWEGYTGKLGGEKDVASYVLGNANRLRTATFSQIKPQRLNELKTLHRASKSCRLIAYTC